MSTQRKLPVDTQTFAELRKSYDVYVDKTPYIAKLVSSGRFFFLSRPHRFGKSLFVSTLKAYFEGKKELFRGLVLEQTEEEMAKREGREAWIAYPVLHFQLNAQNYLTEESLTDNLSEQLSALELSYSLSETTGVPEKRFAYLLQALYQKTQKQVVVLIDEYDKPLLETFEKQELNEVYRSQLKAFYETLKRCDEYIHFAFLTGITKFSKVMLFSGLNNLKDITLLNHYAAICGFTEEELSSYFVPEIEGLAQRYNNTVEETRALLKKKYDGYRFSPSEEQVYNPFSLLNVLSDAAYQYYWFETATPAFLISYLKQINYYVPNIRDGVEVSEGELQDFRVGALNPLPVH